MQIIPKYQDGQFDSTTVSVDASGSYNQIAVIVTPVRLGGTTDKCHSDVVVEGDVGANAITGFKVSIATVVNGTHHDVLVGSDFDTVSNLCPWATSGLATTAALGTFIFKLSSILGAAEIGFWAKAASATSVRVVGSIR